MLTRRLVSASPNPSFLVRTFTTSAAQQKSPSLADVTPNGAPAFDARQMKFREGLKAAHKEKAQADSQFVTASRSRSPSSYSSSPSAAPPGTHGTPNAQDTSNASTDDVSSHHMSLGSLSTHSPEAVRESSKTQETTKRKGALSSLIYGTKEGQQMDQDIEKSFSQVLARGKYVHSIVLHQVKPDKVDEYVKLVGDWYPRMAGIEENHVHLVGSWRTEVGDCDTFSKILTAFGTAARLLDNLLTDMTCSPYLGISALSRLPLLTTLNCFSSRLSRIRPQAQDSHHSQTDITHAGVLFLADYTPTTTRWRLRTPVIHPSPWQPPGMGDTLAAWSEGKKRGHGRRRGLVRPDWRSQYRPSSVAICGPRGAQGQTRDELGSGGLG